MRRKLSHRIHRILFAVLWTFAVLPPALAAQEPNRAALQEVKNRVLKELVDSLPADLPPGYLAVLPGEVKEPTSVDDTVVAGWNTAFAETLQARRPEIELTERVRLEAILREQKFGDSAYADPQTAVRVGKLAAARMLLLSRFHAFHPDNGRIRVHLETMLVDVETGETLWAREVSRGLLPGSLQWLLGAVALLVGAPLLFLLSRGWSRGRRKRLVERELPSAQAHVRIDVDGFARAGSEARERLFRAGKKEDAAAVQTALVDLGPVLDRVRHALPGGSVDHGRVRDLEQALGAARRIESLLEDLRQAAGCATSECRRRSRGLDRRCSSLIRSSPWGVAAASMSRPSTRRSSNGWA